MGFNFDEYVFGPAVNLVKIPAQPALRQPPVTVFVATAAAVDNYALLSVGEVGGAGPANGVVVTVPNPNILALSDGGASERIQGGSREAEGDVLPINLDERFAATSVAVPGALAKNVIFEPFAGGAGASLTTAEGVRTSLRDDIDAFVHGKAAVKLRVASEQHISPPLVHLRYLFLSRLWADTWVRMLLSWSRRMMRRCVS